MVKRRRVRRQDKRPRVKSPRVSKSPKYKSLKERFLTGTIWFLGLVNLALIASLLSEYFASPNENPVSMNAPDLPKQQVITVEVLNACGVQGLANEITQYLRKKKFDVVNIGNYKNFDVDHTLVLDRVSLNGVYAKEVARVLGVDEKQVVPQLNDSLLLNVTVIVGKDYKNLKVYEAIR
ncbi:MAG: LytR C-terminal domain-containing protein [bacterium]